MDLRSISLFFFFLLPSITNIFSQSIPLTAQKDHIRVDKVGTASFPGRCITLEEIAKQEHLTYISGRTYHSAIPTTDTKSYFSKETRFYGEDAENRLWVTYYPDGTCYLEGYIRYDESWIRGTSEGRYYIKNSTVYVTWDDLINEAYKLGNNQYKSDGVLFKLKK